MRRFAVATVLLVLTGVAQSTPALAAPEFWDPDPASVKKVDEAVSRLTSFNGPGCQPPNINDFGRYYGGFTDTNGRRMIVGQLRSLKVDHNPVLANGRPLTEAGVHIVRYPMSIMDGGCSVANVSFDADTLKLIQATWGGY